MFEELSIKDFALIDSAALDFKRGFTILSGETGAGKSILIGAISFLLGGKGGGELIRSGASEALVQGTVFLDKKNSGAYDWLAAHGITIEEDRVLLRRTVKESGKTGARIQDVQVTRTELAEFTSFLVDIHGQHEHQSLLRVSEHRRFLDEYAQLTAEVESFTALYNQLVQLRKKISLLAENDSRRSERISILSFAIEEIDKSALLNGEDETLTAEETRLLQFEKLYSEADSLANFLQGEDANLVSLLKRCRSMAEHCASLDPDLTTAAKRIDSVFYEISDIADEIRSYRQHLVFDPQRLEQVQERLALIFRLKKKYCPSAHSSVADILQYAEQARIELEELTGSEESLADLEQEASMLERTVLEKASMLSAKRAEAAGSLAEKTEQVLAELGMKGTRFSVDLAVKQANAETQKCGPYGIDNIEFLISPNPGSPLLPLAKIASGGELSRVMLALKTILADSDTVETLIFDEIDTGIGGEISIAVGKHLKNLAKHRQVLCITHLASIAVYADTHIKIEKAVQGEKTLTTVHECVGQKRVEEIARMLSGDAGSQESLGHARALLEKYGG